MADHQSSRAFKDEIYQQFARIGKCLSSDKRLELLNLLSQGPKSVENLAQLTEMSVANVSRHLQILFESRLVKFTKKGTYVFYELADPNVAHFLLGLWKLGESQLSDIRRIKEQFLGHFDDLQALSLHELEERLEAGSITLLDVRPRDEYEAAHIPGALSVPIEEIEQRIKELPRNKEIVAYCRGPYCVFASQAAALLQQEGFTAYRLEEGVHEWHQYKEQQLH